jgi:hypothetical protein
VFPNGNHNGVNDVPYSPSVLHDNSLYHTPSAGSFSSTYQSRNYPGISSHANPSSVPKFLTSEYCARIGVSQAEQVGFGLATATSTLDDGIQGNCLNGKRAASSPPGTPHSKAREEQQHWKSRRVAENHVVDWNEDVFAT